MGRRGTVALGSGGRRVAPRAGGGQPLGQGGRAALRTGRERKGGLLRIVRTMIDDSEHSGYSKGILCKDSD